MGNQADNSARTLPSFCDERGCLTYVEGGSQVPFEIRRLFYIYNVVPGATRGAHAHRTARMMIIALAGELELELISADERRVITLNDPSHGRLVEPMTWSVLKNFSKGCICLVLVDSLYDETEYIRDFEEFRQLIKSLPNN